MAIGQFIGTGVGQVLVTPSQVVGGVKVMLSGLHDGCEQISPGLPAGCWQRTLLPSH
jgi:hypothetical protein